MLRTKKADRIVCFATAVMLLCSVFLWGMVEPVQGDGSHTVGYENLLFDQSAVHTIDITMDGWDAFIANAAAEEYTECSITVDGEKYNNVAIRAKGNTSLSSVSALNSTRYSFKVEFNHFVKGMTYHGLDKLSLNNLIQDATMMKDYLAYTLMNRMGVPASLCSYVQISVNGEPWGLYLAVEGVEDAFMDRTGMTKGELYKPDSMSFGGGRGNGRDFDFEKFRVKDEDTADTTETPAAEATPAQSDDGASFGGSSGEQAPQGDFAPSSGDSAQMGQTPGGDFAPSDGTSADNTPAASAQPESGTDSRRPDFSSNGQQGGPGGFGGFNFGMGNDDVKLIYSDDDPDSYSNIFNNAKTNIKEKDKTRLIEALKKLNAKEDLENTVNQDEVIRYLAVHNFLCNGDSYTGMMVHNYYLYEEKGKLSIIPWDYNLGFGGFSASTDATSTVNSPIDSPVSGGTTESRPLIAWIFSDEEALAAYHDAYDRFISGNIENGWLDGEIDRVKALITPYLEKDTSAFYDMEAFEKAVQTLKTFCDKRGQSVRGQLNGTIPSTSNEQWDSDALIDASDVSTADMCSMNTGSNPGTPGGSFSMPQGMPQAGAMPEGTPPEGFAMPDGAGQFFFGQAGDPLPVDSGDSLSATSAPYASPDPAEVSDQPEASRRPQPPEGMNFPDRSQGNQQNPWLTAGLCALLLLAMIIIIRRVRGHNQ